MSKIFKSIKGKFSSSSNDNTQSIKDIYNLFRNNQSIVDDKKYNKTFLELNKYYKKQPHTTNPILYIAVISFNQKKGSLIEFTFPDKTELLEKNESSKLFFESLIDKSNPKLDTIEKIYDNINYQLTYLCMPDGVHSLISDSTFFLIQNFPKILFGISCYRQIKVSQNMKEDEQENTRECVQKAMCIVSTLPLFGQMASKLSVTMLAYFNQDSLKNKKIIEDLYSNYTNNYLNRIKIDEILASFSLKRLIVFTKEKIFTLIKLIMLEKKVLVFSHISNNICSFIFSFLSIFPGGAFFNLNNEGRTKAFYDCYTPYGLPLKFLNENSVLYSILTLYDVDKLENKKVVSYFVGATNPLLMNYGKIDFDCIINLDENKISINHKKVSSSILHLSKKESLLMNKLYSECKYLFEENIDELNDSWMLDKNEKSTNSKKSKKHNSKSVYLQNNEYPSMFTGSDDYIRNIFKKYITNFLSDIDLAQHIATSVGFPEEQKLSKIKSVLNEYNCEFIFNWITKSNSFLFWNFEHDKDLWKFSPHLKQCKNVTKLYENGDVYEGELALGEPNKNGKLKYYKDDTTYIYIGEFYNGKKHGKGNLSSKENDKFSYDGQWANDKYEGYGSLINDGEKYIGYFKNGVKNGKGTLTKKEGDIFEGEFLNGEFKKGKIIYKNEDEFNGTIVDGKKIGKGTYKYKNGDIYEGYFENDVFNGEGKITKMDGEITRGYFKDGKLIKELDRLQSERYIKNGANTENKNTKSKTKHSDNKEKEENSNEINIEKETNTNEKDINIKKEIKKENENKIEESKINENVINNPNDELNNKNMNDNKKSNENVDIKVEIDKTFENKGNENVNKNEPDNN